jgi:hypothetical protein
VIHVSKNKEIKIKMSLKKNKKKTNDDRVHDNSKVILMTRRSW